MEESLNLPQKLKQEFVCENKDVRTYSPLTLAFLGDGVFDLVIRTVIVERGNRSPQQLHKEKSRIVKAGTQALLGEAILDLLNETEQSVYRRGRNAKSGTSAKNASIVEYRKATALEALIGYWYLTGQEDRMIAMVKEGLNRLHIEL